ncbi:MAG TPA: acyl-CoA dehydrogenase family protein [Pseudomonadales bacterium]|jgi:alkylation response protein AidB-like acyl-CoA dehydrogenase|nr:acyl-CoA dehydrogenase family protein [Pseudomonadales bacterium]HMW14587.1 acyl-CoA dehydrogenase family protein [Pseudomonadales bacterium]HMW82372.1 acyl-CoA dehydrogenase family protein [Pseudomonadales bacterium]HMY95950.1 acyl-CoA dehydrogenase family protein [Pseudomonadales bacterium]HMZ70147.1 acyl-CoA dehydrogenase family protein [Pseudomonadales bacterium]
MTTPEPKAHQEFRREVAGWLERNRPAKPDFILPQSFMEVDTQQQFDYLRDWQRKVYEAGYLGMAWPKEYGGGGQPQILQDIATQEMTRANVPFMVNAIGLSWAGPTILHLGSEAHKKQFIKNILNAEEIWCQGFSEPDHGSDLGNAQCRAERDGDHFVVNGAKIWTSLGVYARHMILLARSIPNTSSKYAGLSFFLCPMQTPGIEVIPIKKITGEYGFNQTVFTNARIHESTLVGEEGKGWLVAMAVLAFERGAAGGQAGGNMSTVFSTQDVIEMSRLIERDGRPALEDPLVQDKLLNFLIDQRSIALTSQRARIEKLLTPERPAATMMMGKLFGSEFMRRLAYFAVELQGGRANLYMGDPEAVQGGEWQRAAMNAYSATIGGGTSEVQHNILGERVLDLPK